jgi:hypothetical protein
VGNGIFRNASCVFAISPLVQFHTASAQSAKVSHVHTELLNGTTSEGIASGDENAMTILQKPKADFAEVGRLADSVDADKGDGVWVGLVEGGLLFALYV